MYSLRIFRYGRITTFNYEAKAEALEAFNSFLERNLHGLTDLFVIDTSVAGGKIITAWHIKEGVTV